MNLKNTQLDAGLYFVGTPIGNARDITLRALDVLAQADVIAAEDTRTARKLMDIHGIAVNKRPMIAYHDHNGAKARPRILSYLQDGKSVAYVSEAGMPLIADPGYDLCRAAQEAGYNVTTAPGPTALTTALTIGGHATDRFFFAGFAPPQSTARKRFMGELRTIPATIICYESPTRLAGFLADLEGVFGEDHTISICRELTKKFEEITRGSVKELKNKYENQPPKGELVILIAQAKDEKTDENEIKSALVNAMLTMRVKDASDSIAGLYNLPRRDVYKMALSLKEIKHE